MVQLKQIYIISVLLIALSSCSKKTASHRLKNRSGAVSLFSPVTFDAHKQTDTESPPKVGTHISYLKRQPYEEKATDIPLPVGAALVSGYEDSVQGAEIAIVRSLSLTLREVTDFYLHMLEQTGWCLVAQCLGEHEQLMVWEKPSRVCVISLRVSVLPSRSVAKQSKTFLVIHAGTKEAGCR